MNFFSVSSSKSNKCSASGASRILFNCRSLPEAVISRHEKKVSCCRETHDQPYPQEERDSLPFVVDDVDMDA